MNSFFPKRDIRNNPDYSIYNIVYNKYGNALYGIFLNLCSDNVEAASKLLQEFFVEAFSDNNAFHITIQVNFVQLVKLTTVIAKRNGYHAAEILRSIQRPATVPVLPAFTDEISMQLAIG